MWHLPTVFEQTNERTLTLTKTKLSILLEKFEKQNFKGLFSRYFLQTATFVL